MTSGRRKQEEVKPLYTPADLPGFNYEEELGNPGAYPFTRGIYPTMYRGRLWTMRQYAGFADAAEANRRLRYLLDQGQTGLSVAFDLPTQLGYDSDHPMAAGEVGRVGVAIDSLQDMEVLLKGLPLGEISTSLTINATAPILMAMYVACARKQGVGWGKLSGTVQNDIIKEYVARGNYIFPPGPSMRLVTDLFRFCLQELPHWNPISISGYHMREAGATAVQELAFTLANAIAYLQAAAAAGLQLPALARRLSFFFASHTDLFEEVAKFRAARRLWARIMRERFQLSDPDCWRMRFHVQTGGSCLFAQQPLNNVVRVTIQAMAAVLGGGQSLHTNAWDEALSLPTEGSAGLALRTQQIIAEESGLTASIDPLGGSYYLEHLTRTLEAGASHYLEEIEAMGGALVACEQGFMQRQIEESAYQQHRQMESGERVVVGVNRYTTDTGPNADQNWDLHRPDPHLEEAQVTRLERLKAARDQQAVQRHLQSLQESARGGEALMPVIIECVESYATLGEISQVWRQVFGEYRP